MIKLIVVCHGAFASGLVDAMELIAGPQPEVTAIGLDEAGSVSDLEAQIEAAVLERRPGQGVLIMVDLFGASPFNASARVSQRHTGVEVITGANLAMLLETALSREDVSLVEMVATAREAGMGSVKVLSELLNQG